MRQCAQIWSDNLQLPYTSKLEVMRDQINPDLLVYNLQLPDIWQLPQERNTTDRTDRQNLTFQDTCKKLCRAACAFFCDVFVVKYDMEANKMCNLGQEQVTN